MTEEESEDFNKFKFLYEVNMKIALEFWEWRHKVLTRFFVSVGSLLFLTGWLYKEASTISEFLFVPLLFGSLLSYFFLHLDVRNDDILKNCYKIGSTLEQEQGYQELMFSKLLEFKENKKTYHYLLRMLYGTTSAIMFILAVATAYKFL